MYCCSDFEILSEDHAGFSKQDDGTWSIFHAHQCCEVKGMKFCPFCGSDLAPRFVVEEFEGSNVFNWVVKDTLNNRVVAHFEHHYDARKHADKCK